MFGTLCVFDRNDHAQATQFQELLSLFRQLIEKDLCALVEMGKRDDLLAELQRHRDHLREMTAEQTAELETSKAMLEERIRFEYLISDLSAGFLNVPPERAADEIALILDRVCQFFGADHCRLQEVLADRRQIKLVHMDLNGEGRREALDADIVSGRPWAYHQLVELGEPVVFSSLEALPPEASVDRATWEHEGVRALLMLPLRIWGKVTHVIALRSHHPHDWPVVHIRRLRVLGEIFAGAMIHRRNEEALLKSEQGLAEAQRIAHVGSWEYDLATGKLQWSDEVYRMLGLPPREFRATYTVFLALVHPVDRGAIEQALHDAFGEENPAASLVSCPGVRIRDGDRGFAAVDGQPDFQGLFDREVVGNAETRARRRSPKRRQARVPGAGPGRTSRECNRLWDVPQRRSWAAVRRRSSPFVAEES